MAKGFGLKALGRAAGAAAALGFAVMAYVYLTLPDVRVLATQNPERTAWMELRTREAAQEGKTIRHVRRWVPYSRISASLKRAVLVAEDSAFWDHEGVDYEQLRDAIQVSWEQGRAVRGASTITQQLAKNLYLSPVRDPIRGPIRKLKELIIARRMEAALPKARIFEIYLNSIEWGDGIWGAEAAARTYFGIPASSLNAQQSALLAGAIINPRVLNPARPTARLLSRQRIILARMGDVTPPTPAPTPVVIDPPVEEPQPQPDTPIGDPPTGEPPVEAPPAPPPTQPDAPPSSPPAESPQQ